MLGQPSVMLDDIVMSHLSCLITLLDPSQPCVRDLDQMRPQSRLHEQQPSLFTIHSRALAGSAYAAASTNTSSHSPLSFAL